MRNIRDFEEVLAETKETVAELAKITDLQHRQQQTHQAMAALVKMYDDGEIDADTYYCSLNQFANQEKPTAELKLDPTLNFTQQVSEIADAMDKVGVVSAMHDALSNPLDHRAAFRSAWVVAKAFFYLGDNLSELEMISKAAQVFLVDREGRQGSKMAFIDRQGRQGLVVVTMKGSIVMTNDMLVEMRGAFGKIDRSLDDMLSDIVAHLILGGLPFLTFCDILDRFHDKPEMLKEQLEKLYQLMNWSVV